jgi:hypothetical protein
LGGHFAHLLDRGLVGQKVAAVNRIVEMLNGESPSPFVLTAPLIPPCAQTECERLTGTTEIKSTSCPASAIFIAAAKPAKPPPTIAIFNSLVAIFLQFLCFR